MDEIFEKNRPVIAAGILYTITAMVVVISAWAVDLHQFDMELTISLYVGLRHWTAYLYMVIAVIMVSLVMVYLKKSDIHIVRKILYGVAFLCILGCAFFPHNEEWSVFASNLHNYFAYILMSVVFISMIMMIIKAKNKSQRVYGIVSTAYGIFFIIAYIIIGLEIFVDTIFLWENTFIYLLLGELMVEYEESRLVEIFSKRFPIVGIAGIPFAWLVYLVAPREDNGINQLGPVFWKVMTVTVLILLICYIIFNLSFIMYMLYRPLAEKRKWLDIAIRVIISPVVMVAMFFGTYLSIFIIGGGGY